MSKKGPFYALSFRNFRLFFIGQLISVAGTWMQVVAQAWLVYEITKSPAWLGIVAGAGAIPYALFTIHGGKYADRHSRRDILVWTQTIPMILAFIQAALATNRWLPIEAWEIAFLSGVNGLVNAYNMPAQQAFVTDMVDDRDALGNAIALNSFRFNIARFLGPILAGLALVRYGAATCFFINGLSFLAVIVSLKMMRVPNSKLRDRDVDTLDGIRYVRAHPTTLRIIVLIGCGSVFAWSASTLFPVFASRYHTGAAGYSSMMAYNGVGAALGGILIATFGEKFPRLFVIYGGSFLFSLALLLFSVTRNYQIALALLVLSGFFMILFGISSNTKVQEDVPDHLRGRVMAVYSLVFGGLMPVGGLEIGFLAQRIGSVAAIRINATLCALATVIMVVWNALESSNTLKMEKEEC